MPGRGFMNASILHQIMEGGDDAEHGGQQQGRDGDDGAGHIRPGAGVPLKGHDGGDAGHPRPGQQHRGDNEERGGADGQKAAQEAGPLPRRHEVDQQPQNRGAGGDHHREAETLVGKIVGLRVEVVEDHSRRRQQHGQDGQEIAGKALFHVRYLLSQFSFLFRKETAYMTKEKRVRTPKPICNPVRASSYQVRTVSSRELALMPSRALELAMA